MTPALWTITLTVVGTGAAVVGLVFTMLRTLKADIKADIWKLDQRSEALSIRLGTLESDLRERFSRIEGKLDLLLQGLQIRIEPGARAGSG